MNICPKCGKPYNIDYYKKRGCCSECGFSFKADLRKEESKDKYNAAIRKKAVEAAIPQTNKKLIRCNATSLNNNKNSPKVSPEKKDTPLPDEPHKENDLTPEDKESNTSTRSSTERLFANDDAATSNTAPSKKSDDKNEEYTPDWNDAIFLNADRLEISDDDSEEEYNHEEMRPDDQSADDDIDIEDEYIDDDGMDEDSDGEIRSSSTSNKGDISNFLSDVIHFEFVKKLLHKRKEKREEQFETDRKFDFNSDGYYDDVKPEVEPETDIIPLKSVLKVVSIIVGIFLFIAFIIYYA